MDDWRLSATFEVVLVVVIWSSSFVGVELLLEYTGPLTVAGLRYALAFVLLLPLLLRQRAQWTSLNARRWQRLGLMGLCQYALGNGALFWALTMVSATAGSLVLCLVPIAVLALEILWLKERPRPLQMTGIMAAVGGGVLVFSSGLQFPPAVALGGLTLALFSFAVLPVLAREAARDQHVRTRPLTALPLGLGGVPLLGIVILWEGVPVLPAQGWLIAGGLAVNNTALAYMLYTHALARLKAMEANVILNAVPVGTAVLAHFILGEAMQALQVPAIALVVLGVTLTQQRRRRWQRARSA